MMARRLGGSATDASEARFRAAVARKDFPDLQDASRPAQGLVYTVALSVPLWLLIWKAAGALL